MTDKMAERRASKERRQHHPLRRKAVTMDGTPRTPLTDEEIETIWTRSEKGGTAMAPAGPRASATDDVDSNDAGADDAADASDTGGPAEKGQLDADESDDTHGDSGDSDSDSDGKDSSGDDSDDAGSDDAEEADSDSDGTDSAS
jgi:hypothetical protein